MEKPNIDFADVKRRFENLKIKWVAMSGIYPDLMEERHSRIIMPLKDLHINHVGTAYAGSIFVLAEISVPAIIYCTYGVGKWLPIISRVEIDYIKPSTKDLIADVKMTADEAAEKIKPIEERGKGRMTLLIPITNTDGEDIARATVIAYLMPAGGGK